MKNLKLLLIPVLILIAFLVIKQSLAFDGGFTWDNDNFITGAFWDNNPSDTDIIDALFGNTGDTQTSYTSGRATNPCDPSLISVTYISGGGDWSYGDVSNNTIYSILSGTYSVTGNITLNNCSAIIGDGNATLVKNALDGVLFSDNQHLIVDNLVIDSNNTGYTNGFTLNHGIILTGSQNVSINNVEAKNDKDSGIYVYHGSYINISNSEIHDNGAGDGGYDGGIYVRRGTGIIVKNIEAYNNVYYGIYMVNIIDSKSNNITGYNNYGGFQVVGGLTENFTLSNSVFSGNSQKGLYISAQSTTPDNVLVENVISHYNNIGLEIGSARNITISGSEFHDNVTRGIQILGDDNKIHNSKIYNNGSDGIYIRLGENNTINLSEIYNNDYGIRISPPEEPADKNNINNSKIFNNTNFGVYIKNSSYNTINNSQIFNNTNGISRDGGGYNILNNSQVYNNHNQGDGGTEGGGGGGGLCGIKIINNSTNNLINNTKIFNNTDEGILINPGSSLTFYGENEIFNNTINITDSGGNGLITGYDSDSLINPLGWEDGSITLSGTVDESAITNPENSFNIFLVDTGTAISNRIGNKTWTGTSTVSYTYGSDTSKQKQPAKWNSGNTGLLYYGNSGIDWNLNKYITNLDLPGLRSYIVGLVMDPREDVGLNSFDYNHTWLDLITIGNTYTFVFNYLNNLGRVSTVDDILPTPFHHILPVPAGMQNLEEANMNINVKTFYK